MSDIRKVPRSVRASGASARSEGEGGALLALGFRINQPPRRPAAARPFLAIRPPVLRCRLCPGRDIPGLAAAAFRGRGGTAEKIPDIQPERRGPALRFLDEASAFAFDLVAHQGFGSINDASEIGDRKRFESFENLTYHVAGFQDCGFRPVFGLRVKVNDLNGPQ